MRRLGLRTEGAEILCRSEVAKGLVRSVVIVSVGEGVDEGLEFVDAAGQVVCGVEFVSPRGLGAFDAAVEVGTFWRQDHELEAVFPAMILEDGHELGSAVDLDAFDLERSGGDELVEQGFCGAGGSVGGDVGKGPFGDRVVGGEVLEGPVGTQVDKQRVDLDQFAGLFGFASLGQALGVALALGHADAAAAGPAAQDRHGDDRAAGDEPAEDAPDGGDGRGQAVAVEELGDLSLAPHRVVGAQGLNRCDESQRPFRLARALGTPRQGLRRSFPAVQRRACNAHRLRRPFGAQAIGDRAAPARHGVASSRGFDIGGLRREKTRRRSGVSDNMSGQATNLHGGLRGRLIRNSQLRRPLLLFQTAVSYLSEPGQASC